MRSSMKASVASLALAVLAGAPAFAQQRTLTYYADYDPAPLAAMEGIIADFEAANPDIDVVLQNFDHEGYKTAIRNFLTADAPDLANWYAGNRMAPFVNAGQFMDVSDVWEANDLGTKLASAKASMTIDGKQWGVPYTYYQWGIYYNKDVYAQVGAEVPDHMGRIHRQLRQVQGSRHRLPDHRDQGAVARGRHLRLHELAHQRL